jgi:hypothetical protein
MMSFKFLISRRRLAALLAASCSTLVAQTGTVPGLPSAPTPNATINLIRLMVEQKLLPAEAAAKLIQQAEDEAAQARAALAQAAAPAPAPTAPAADPAGTVRVTYIPPHVRRQMVEEVRQEVMSEAIQERWADPQALPEWATRWRFLGDVRFRHESVSFPRGNDNTGTFVNFSSLNNGNGLQVNSNATSTPVPFLNVDEDRQRLRIRARLGAEVNLLEGFSSGVRLATGESNSPITQNQTLGGGSGNFSKYSLWLDRAFLKYETEAAGAALKVTAGRMENPFFATSMIWANDLGFDGVALQSRRPIGEAFTPFVTAGLFPVFNTAFDFSTNQTSKTASYDKWLYAVQAGTDWKIGKDFEAKVAVAYYQFENIEGSLSSPTEGTALSPGDTDASRPLFTQKGNTYRPIRNIIPRTDSTQQFQYFGLATPYREIALTGRLDYNHFEPIQVSLIGEVVKNVALEKDATAAVAFNNLDAANRLAGGDLGFFAAVQVGHAALTERWNWNASLGYRYVETDAVVDGFADSDFGGGGTNVKGFTLGGNLALSGRVWIGARLMSADQIDGSTYKNDTFQFDINGRF